MARAFKSTPKGFVADLEKAERRLLRTLFGDVIQLLDAEEPRPGSAAPETPATGTPVAGNPVAENPAESAGDPFWDIVAGLGGEGAGVGPSDPHTAALHREAPRDEALARLLPPGVHGDTADEQAAAGEFRALTEDSVRRSKTADLQRAVAALQVNPLVLDEENAVAFSRALNDVRLVLSARLGIDSEEDAERVHTVDDWAAATDVESYMALLYNFTTWLLETLMLALSTQLPDQP
ncbi:DUF2017 family protein [Microbacterium sp. A93]|uniref:DUF2017 family protein n=1 Tax=Microbacterium sp. A93 TaxID=3450716 RepID=UPI003F426E11